MGGRGVEGGPRFGGAARGQSCDGCDAPEPGSGRLADVAPHARTAGATARSIRSTATTSRSCGWSGRAAAPGIQEGTPLVYGGVHVHAEPERHHPGHRRGDRRSASGSTSASCRRTSASPSRSRRSTGTSRSTATRSSTPSADDYVFALDARPGKLVWETKVLDYRQQRREQRSGPIIANGKVITGRGCEPEGGPEACVITAHDARTGKELWRTRTIPEAGRAGGRDAGATCRYEKRWHVGTWMVPSYDPELNLIYIGTSVTSPAPKFMLGGNDTEHLYHNSHAGAERRHRQDRLVLPARRRSLGSRPPVRAAARRYRRRPETDASAVDQPAARAGREAEGDHGHSRKDRASSTRSTGRRANSSGRGRPSRRTCVVDIDGDRAPSGQPGDRLHGRRAKPVVAPA